MPLYLLLVHSHLLALQVPRPDATQIEQGSIHGKDGQTDSKGVCQGLIIGFEGVSFYIFFLVVVR